jgi:D-tyrosyl-tRNA(Tyr) deacylase
MKSMRAIVQRVSEARVSVEGAVIGQIGSGLLIFLAIHRDDSEREAQKLCDKILRLRIFADQAGKMNLNVLQTYGSILIVSQFTLYGDTSKGNRPSYSEAAPPEKARHLYNLFIQSCRSQCGKVATGEFQSHMEVQLVNDGPVTLLCQVES